MKTTIFGAHVLLYSRNADADRAFLRDVLGFRGVDVGGGWLILSLPPAEVAVHPGSGDFVERHAGHDMLGALLYLMCGDVREEMSALARRGVNCSTLQEAEWGLATTIPLPSGGAIGLYQPLHETALNRSPTEPSG